MERSAQTVRPARRRTEADRSQPDSDLACIRCIVLWQHGTGARMASSGRAVQGALFQRAPRTVLLGNSVELSFGVSSGKCTSGVVLPALVSPGGGGGDTGCPSAPGARQPKRDVAPLL